MAGRVTSSPSSSSVCDLTVGLGREWLAASLFPLRLHSPSPRRANENEYKNVLTSLPKPAGEFGKYYSLPALNDPRIGAFLVLLIQLFRFLEKSHNNLVLVLAMSFNFFLFCMWNAINRLASDPNKINPLVAVDLVVDHSVQVDVARSENALQANMSFEGTKKDLLFLNGDPLLFTICLLFISGAILYPNSVVGTDSHTTMIDGLGISGWEFRVGEFEELKLKLLCLARSHCLKAQRKPAAIDSARTQPQMTESKEKIIIKENARRTQEKEKESRRKTHPCLFLFSDLHDEPVPSMRRRMFHPIWNGSPAERWI
ncbi:Aconitate hydratase, cytoplasmic [Apostasia shenzhenica]|uniref:Aconitate hydratase, cytoplasmic n=1 Tax=Apostasia shenzhenica TaxID=1088818 RepID=A0A2H9ZUC6_9ASPA|nr:Aconitate hydratase, cytoplasmic [Apostasia shenzhenica]